MFTHYLKIAWRNMLKYKTTYDSFHPDSDRIYQVYGTLKSTGKLTRSGQVPYIAVNKLEQAFPEIESVAVVYPNYGSGIKHGDRNLGYPLFQFVDEPKRLPWHRGICQLLRRAWNPLLRAGNP